jgi:hypothetical protein
MRRIVATRIRPDEQISLPYRVLRFLLIVTGNIHRKMRGYGD